MSKLCFFKGQTQVISVVLLMGLAVSVIGATYLWGKPLIEKSQAGTTMSQAESTMSLIKETIDDVARSGTQKTKQIQVDGILEVSEKDNAIVYQVTSPKAAIASSQWVVLNDDTPPKILETFAVDAQDPLESANVPSCSSGCAMRASSPCGNIVMSSCGAVDGTYSPGQSFSCGARTYTVDHVDCGGSIDGFAVLVGPESELAGIVGKNQAGVLAARSVPLDGSEYLTVYQVIYREVVDPNNKEGAKILLKVQGNSQVMKGAHTITVKRGSSDIVNAGSALGGDITKTTVFVTLE